MAKAEKGGQIWTCENQAHGSIIADMRRAFFLPILVCALLIPEPARAALVILKDEFDGESIDSSKWSVAAPFSNSSVVQTEGKLTLNNNGQVTALVSPTAPYSIVLSNVVMSSFEVLSITVRSDGVIPPGQEVAPGIRFHLWNQNGYSGAFYYPATIEGGQSLQEHGYFTKTDSYTIRIDDDGETLALHVNGTQIFTTASTLSSGNKITIFNRGTQTGWGIPSSTSIGSIEITQEVPPDSDNDGVNNYREDKDGTNPTDSNSFNTLSRGLIAHYPFSGNAYDESGHSVHFQSGPFLFFGPDRKGSETNATSFTSSPPIVTSPFTNPSYTTVSFWIKLTAVPSVYGERIILNGSFNVPWTDDACAAFGVAVWHNGRFAISWLNQDRIGQEIVLPPGTVAMNQWYQVFFTADESFVKFGLNGKVIDSVEGSLLSVSHPISIGGETDYFFDSGLIDELRVYDRALSESELEQLFYSEAFRDSERQFLTANPGVMGHYSEAEYDANRTNGQTDVTTNPAAFNLFTQSQLEANYSSGVTTGINTVLSNPASYNLYDSNSIMDLRMGGLMVQKNGSNAVVSFQPQTTTDLTQPFTNNGTPITHEVPMPGNKGFIRINAKPEQSAP